MTSVSSGGDKLDVPFLRSLLGFAYNWHVNVVRHRHLDLALRRRLGAQGRHRADRDGRDGHSVGAALVPALHGHAPRLRLPRRADARDDDRRRADEAGRGDRRAARDRAVERAKADGYAALSVSVERGDRRRASNFLGQRVRAGARGGQDPHAAPDAARLARSSIHGHELRDERRVDRVVDRRLPVEDLGARGLELRHRAVGELDRDHRVVGSVRRPRSAGTAGCRRAASPPRSGRSPRTRSPPSGRGRPSPRPDGEAHHGALREAADQLALVRAASRRTRRAPRSPRRTSPDRDSRRAARRTSARRRAVARAARAGSSRAGGAPGRGRRRARAGRARSRRGRGRGRTRPRPRPRRAARRRSRPARARIGKRRQPPFELGAQPLVVRRQREMLAERLERLVGGEARARASRSRTARRSARGSRSSGSRSGRSPASAGRRSRRPSRARPRAPRSSRPRRRGGRCRRPGARGASGASS